MRPENLKLPFTWEERRVVIHDHVWFVPSHCERFSEFLFPGWEHPDLFGNTNPVNIEYCSGNGAWIAGKAAAHPCLNWVAIERKFPRARKIWSKIKNLNLKNLVVICGEGHHVTTRYFPMGSVNEIYINFPDPWPKKKHWKNRLIQTSFVEELHRILKLNGHMTFVTDDVPYSEWTIEKMLANPGFKSHYQTPFHVTEHNEYGTSYFDQLWREKGRIIRYHKFQKQ